MQYPAQPERHPETVLRHTNHAIVVTGSYVTPRSWKEAIVIKTKLPLVVFVLRPTGLLLKQEY